MGLTRLCRLLRSIKSGFAGGSSSSWLAVVLLSSPSLPGRRRLLRGARPRRRCRAIDQLADASRTRRHRVCCAPEQSGQPSDGDHLGRAMSPDSSPSSLFSALSDDDCGSSRVQDEQRQHPAASLLPPPIPGLHLLPSLLPPQLASALIASIARADLFAGGTRDQVMLFGETALGWCVKELGAVRAWGDELLRATDGEGGDKSGEGEEERKRLRTVWERSWRAEGRSRQGERESDARSASPVLAPL